MGKRTGSGKRTGRKVLKVAVLIFIVWIAAGVIQNRDTVWPFLLESIGADAGLHSIPATEEWELIVVNRWNEIPDGYSVSLTELSNGQKVDNRIYPYLQEMFDAARMDGIYPVVREGYRTAEEQQKILDDKIQAYMREGYSRSRAERTAKEWVAQPGTSEHQLGIAVDINADKSRSTNRHIFPFCYMI